MSTTKVTSQITGFMSSFPSRGIYPPNHEAWLQNELHNAETWEKNLAAWKAQAQLFREQTQKHVFEKKEKDLSWSDFLQHRAGLLYVLSNGDLLALELHHEYVEHFGIEKAKAFLHEIAIIEDSLMKELFEWHGPLEAQPDLPPELIQGFKDVDAGHLVNLDAAMTDVPKNL